MATTTSIGFGRLLSNSLGGATDPIPKGRPRLTPRLALGPIRGVPIPKPSLIGGLGLLSSLSSLLLSLYL